MARIDLNHIRHAYGPNPKSDKDYALKEVHHSWEDGGAYALLGPSGCGKTTLLEHHIRADPSFARTVAVQRRRCNEPFHRRNAISRRYSSSRSSTTP